MCNGYRLWALGSRFRVSVLKAALEESGGKGVVAN